MKRNERRLESEKSWDAMAAALTGGSILDVARRFDVTPGDLAAALVRTGTRRQAVIAEGSEAPPLGSQVEASTTAPPAEPAPSASSGSDAKPPEGADLDGARAKARPGKMDDHAKGYRAAAQTGGGRAFLSTLHKLVQGNLRRRIARDPADGDLLASIDRDLQIPIEAAADRAGVPPGRSLPEGSPSSHASDPRRARSRPRPSESPSTVAVDTGTVGPVDGPRSVEEGSRSASTRMRRTRHVYTVGVLLEAARRDYGLVASSMAEAVDLATIRTGGTVVHAVRQLEALE